MSIFWYILEKMTTNNTTINELCNSHKLDGTNYDMWKRKIQYLLDDKDLLEHWMVAKFPPFDKDKDGNPIDTANVRYKKILKAYED